MDPHLPFLKTIAADPADDLPRLVYADFLEETGEPVHVARADFIRTQIALESFHPRTRQYREAKALEERLEDMFMDDWLLDLPEYLHKQERVTWRRGFPDGIRLGPGFPHEWAAWCSPEWFDLHPVRNVQIERVWGPGACGLFSRIQWTRISGMRLGPQMTSPGDEGEGDPIILDLMTASGFPALRSLDLSENHLTDAWLVHFVSTFPTASFAATLKELDLSRCFQLTDAGANTLATARGLDGLKALRLTGVPLSAPAITMLRRRFGERLVGRVLHRAPDFRPRGQAILLRLWPETVQTILLKREEILLFVRRQRPPVQVAIGRIEVDPGVCRVGNAQLAREVTLQREVGVMGIDEDGPVKVVLEAGGGGPGETKGN